MTASSFLSDHHGIIPAGPILFLGAGDSTAARELAQTGRSVTTLEAPSEHRRLGYQCWAAIISLFIEWPTPLRRRLFGQIPNALKPGGVFLMEAYAVGPSGPLCLDDGRLDPIDVRPELEMLQLARFVSAPGPDGMTTLQVVGIHPEGGDESLDEPRPDLPLRAA